MCDICSWFKFQILQQDIHFLTLTSFRLVWPFSILLNWPLYTSLTGIFGHVHIFTPNKKKKKSCSLETALWTFLGFVVLRQACFLKVFNVFWDIKTISSDYVMSPEGRTDYKQTCSSSLMAAMLFWNLSRPQKVEIPSFVFWTRTCSRPPCSRFSESELSCLQQREVGLFLVSPA